MLIRTGGQCSYFFSKFCFQLALDICFDLLNVGLRRSFSQFCSESVFQRVILRKFSHDQLKLAVWYFIVSQIFRMKPVDRISLGDCECNNLSMFFFFLFSNQASYWQLSAQKKRERKRHQRYREELRQEDPQQRVQSLNPRLKKRPKENQSRSRSSWQFFLARLYFFATPR